MKKVIGILLTICMGVSLSGCGASATKDGKDVLKVFEENNYRELFSVYDNFASGNAWLGIYFDTDLNAYVYNYLDKEYLKNNEIGRFLKKPESLDMNLVNDEGNKLNILTVNNDGKEHQAILFSSNSKDYYNYYFDEEQEYVYLPGDDSNSKSCNYYFKEGKKLDDSVCKSSRLEDAKNAKKDYQDTIKKLDLNNDDIITMASWSANNIKKDVLKGLVKRFDSQQELTNDEITKLLKLNGYLISSQDNGRIYVTDDKVDVSLLGVALNSSTTNVVAYTEELYHEAAISLTYLYEADFNREVVMGDNGKYIYDLTNKISLENTNCSADFIDRAESIQYSFTSFLAENRLTRDELVKYVINYK